MACELPVVAGAEGYTLFAIWRRSGGPGTSGGPASGSLGSAGIIQATFLFRARARLLLAGADAVCPRARACGKRQNSQYGKRK